jgi:hypothetical protein
MLKSFLIAVMLGLAQTGWAVSVISDATGLFTTSFRLGSNTTYFGWSEGQFFGQPVPPSTSRILNNPSVSFGNVGVANGVQFFQNDRSSPTFVMIGSSVGNIYTGSGPVGKEASATLVVPTLGMPGAGFTTIILQGRTIAAGGFSSLETLVGNFPVFTVAGGGPTEFAIGGNTANQGQWWAKFELPGNSPNIQVDIRFPGGSGTTPISIAQMSVDTLWSATGFASDSAVPEPSSVALILGAGVGWAWFRRRKSVSSQS